MAKFYYLAGKAEHLIKYSAYYCVTYEILRDCLLRGLILKARSLQQSTKKLQYM